MAAGAGQQKGGTNGAALRSGLTLIEPASLREGDARAGPRILEAGRV